MDMPDTIGGLVLAYALESDQLDVRANVRRLVRPVCLFVSARRIPVVRKQLIERVAALGR
jgi:hypothetical protein